MFMMSEQFKRWNILNYLVQNIYTINHQINDLLEDSSSDEDDDIAFEEQFLNRSNLTAPEAGFIQIINNRKNAQAKVCGYVDEIIPSYTMDTFRMHFRLSRKSYELVKSYIASKQTPKFRRPPHSLDTILLSVIWLLATPDSYRSVSDRFGISKSTLSEYFNKTINMLLMLSKDIITWPSQTQCQAYEEGFQNAANFPKVIGVIDGCHIPIKAPVLNPESYVNRKGFHSIILQAVCNNEMKFIDCYAGCAGSMHDSRVLRRSPLLANINNAKAQHFPNESHLLGDSAYPIEDWLIVPFKDNGHLNHNKMRFNNALSTTRCVIERSFALLKGRFRRLKYLDMNTFDLIPKVIIACCVLHNICLENENDFEELLDMSPHDLAINVNEISQGTNPLPGIEKRHAIMEAMFA